MRTLQALGLALAFALFATSASAAQTVTGRVVAKDSASHTITVETDAGTRQVFATDTSTGLQRSDGGTLTINDLRVGDHVQVVTDSAAGTTNPVATRVEVMNAGTTGTAATTGNEATNADRIREQNAATGKTTVARDDANANPDNNGSVTGATGTRTRADTGTRMARNDTNATTERGERHRGRLPRTAGPLPLLALIGAGSLASGLVLRRVRR